MAGQIQAQSASHPIEAKIRAAEPENKESCDYWVSRAYYYFGRKDTTAMVAAYEKALNLCPIKTETDYYKRGSILNSYDCALRELRAPNNEISRLLEREYKLAPPGTHYMRCVLSEMLYFDEQQRMSSKPRRALSETTVNSGSI